jgi:hypothetical protein
MNEKIRKHMNSEYNEPALNGGQVCDQMGFSRWTMHRCKKRGYVMEYGNRTSLSHFKRWLRANPFPDRRSDNNRAENPLAQAAMIRMGLVA